MAVRIFTAQTREEADEIVEMLERRAVLAEKDECDVLVDDDHAMQALKLIREYYDLDHASGESEQMSRRKTRRKQTRRTFGFIIFVCLIVVLAILIMQNM